METQRFPFCIFGLFFFCRGGLGGFFVCLFFHPIIEGTASASQMSWLLQKPQIYSLYHASSSSLFNILSSLKLSPRLQEPIIFTPKAATCQITSLLIWFSTPSSFLGSRDFLFSGKLSKYFKKIFTHLIWLLSQFVVGEFQVILVYPFARTKDILCIWGTCAYAQ